MSSVDCWSKSQAASDNNRPHHGRTNRSLTRGIDWLTGLDAQRETFSAWADENQSLSGLDAGGGKHL